MLSKRLVIGFMGTEQGLGTTHLSVSMASYIALTTRKKVLYVELAARGCICDMNPDRESDEEFELDRVVYWPRKLIGDLNQAYSRGYDVIVIDFGERNDWYWNEFVRCDRRFMVGSLVPWRLKNTENFLRMHMHNSFDKSEILLVNGGNKIEKKIISRRYQILVKTIPYIPDPMRPESQWPEFFHELLY